MPSGAVIRYDGARGVVFRIKYQDADGVQVQETLGREKDGWTRARAKAELRARLTDVEREGLRRQKPVTFASFAEEWIGAYPEAQTLKRSTTGGYRSILNRHLLPAFGLLKLAALDVARLERYVAVKRKAKLAPRTINRHLNLLHSLLAAAVKRGLLRSNPVEHVDRPREPRRRWKIATPAEIARIERAFTELAAEADDDEERAWLEQARVVFLVVYTLGLRRGEVLGLRWASVMLADPEGARLRVAETWVRHQEDTPKSEAGERTLAIGPRLAVELFDHRARSAYDGDDERVFCNPEKGTAMDPKRYAASFRAALSRAGLDDRRPFHDGRHTAITNEAAAGNGPAALQARAGHSSFTTTQAYIDLAGVVFREEAERAEARLYGATTSMAEATEGKH
jgi:integrase